MKLDRHLLTLLATAAFGANSMGCTAAEALPPAQQPQLVQNPETVPLQLAQAPIVEREPEPFPGLVAETASEPAQVEVFTPAPVDFPEILSDPCPACGMG